MFFRITAILFLFPCIPPLAAQKPEAVRIGLLIQDQASLAAIQGAQLAVGRTNARGGINGRPVQLVVRSMEGPWGTGSKQAVDLIFTENVWALLGSHDGRNAHLVEQAATKSAVVFVSAWPSDPTLSQAFVPWFFNCVPNDRQQADVLIDEIYNKRKLNKVATITDRAYDSSQAMKSFLQSLQLAAKDRPVQFNFDDYAAKLEVLADQITKADIQCILLFCQPVAALKLVRLIRQRKMNQPVFGTLSILNENELSDQELHEFNGILLAISAGSGSNSNFFQDEYRKTYGKMPGMVAAYAFDGMNVLIEAIRTSGVPEREKIQQALTAIHYEGVTGPVQFDNKGNRSARFQVRNVAYGLQAPAKRE